MLMTDGLKIRLLNQSLLRSDVCVCVCMCVFVLVLSARVSMCTLYISVTAHQT